MSEVKDVRNAILSTISTVNSISTNNFSELRYTIDVEKNTFEGGSNRYGVLPLDGDIALATRLKARDFVMNYQVILTDTYVDSGMDDSENINAIMELYGIMDDIIDAAINTKLGLGNAVVRKIDEGSIAEPEYLEDNKVVVLRKILSVQYGRNL